MQLLCVTVWIVWHSLSLSAFLCTMCEIKWYFLTQTLVKIMPFWTKKKSDHTVFNQNKSVLRNEELWTLRLSGLCFFGGERRPAGSPDGNRLSFWTEEKTITKTAVLLCEDQTVVRQWSPSPWGLVKGSLVVLCLHGGYCATVWLVTACLGVSQFSAFNNLLYSYHGIILASRLSLDAFTTLRAVHLKLTFSNLYFNQLTGLIKQIWRPHFSIFWFPHTN